METTFRNDERKPITATMTLRNNGKISDPILTATALKGRLFTVYGSNGTEFIFATAEFENA